MKRITKKLLAILLAAVLAVTALPLSAITAFADGQSELEAAIGRYDEMCSALAGEDGYANLKTNLVPVYEAYISALRTLNNVDADGTTVYSSDADMRNAATTLNTALANCKPFTEYEATAVPTMGGTTPESDYYNKVIYAQDVSAMGDASVCSYIDASGAGTVRYIIYYPNAVLLDDGKDTKTVDNAEVNDRPVLPVILGMYNSNSTSYVRYVIESTDHFDLINDHWKGDLATKNNTTAAANNNAISNALFWNPYGDNLLMAEADAASDDEAYKKPINFVSLKNGMRYYRSNNSNDTLVTVSSTDWLTQQDTGSTTVVGHKLTANKSKVYIIKYNKLIEALKKNLKKYSDTGYFSREYIEEALLEGNGTITDILKPLFEALDTATGLNPSNYDYATDIDKAAKKCAADIDAAIDVLETAKPDNVLASINNLKRVIREYEKKMNSIKTDGKVLTNMEPAYQAYVKAKKYANAYDYGLVALEEVLRVQENDFVSVTHSIDAVAKDFDKKVNAMEPISYGNYNYVPEEAFQNDTTSMPKSKWYNESYRNLVYASKGPVREVSGTSYNDNTAYGLLRLNQEYNTTNLYTPRIVAVYDNDNQRFNDKGESSTTGDYIASLPIMLGYLNDYTTTTGTSNTSGTRWLHNYVIRSFDESSPEVKLVGNWLTGTDSAGNIRTQHMLSLANITENSDTYGMKNKLNSVMTGDMTAIIKSGNAQYATNTISTYYNDTNGYTLFSDAVTPSTDIVTNYEYFANRMYVNLPNFEDATRIAEDPVNHYFYEINDFWAAQTGIPGRNGAFSSISYTKTSSVAGRFQSKSSTFSYFTGWRVATMGKPSLVIINYKPIRERIEKGKALLTDSEFDIGDYSEGGLETYLYNMTELTSVDPRNSKYDYSRIDSETDVRNSDDSSYICTDEAYECATDIYNLLDKEGTKVILPDSDDVEVIKKAYKDSDKELCVDTLTVEEGDNNSNYYYELMQELASIDEIKAQYDLTCLDDTAGIYDDYDAAVDEAREAMAKVAVNGYAESQETVLGYKNAIESAATELMQSTTSAPRNQHAARYKARKSNDRTNVEEYETALFECVRNTASHEVATADMSVYDPLQIAVDSIDYERYNNDNIIKNAETILDKLTDDVVAKRTVGADAVKPQDMVDDAISQMLTAINVANTDEDNYKYTSKYNVTFNKQTADNGAASTVETTENINYGTTQSFNIPSSEGTVYKWVIETLDDNGNVLTKSIRLVDPNVEYTEGEKTTDPETGKETVEKISATNKYSLEVQANVRITAYIMPAVADGKVIVKVNNAYGKTGLAYLLDESTTVQAEETSQTKDGTTTYTATSITLGDYSFDVNNAAIQLARYTNNSFNIGNNSITNKTLKAVASNGVFTVNLNADKNIAAECNITYNGATAKYATETELITLTSKTESGFVAIAVKSGDKYTPVSYNKTIQFYGYGDMEFADITTEDGIFYYAGSGDSKVLLTGDNYDDYFYYALNKNGEKKLPFVFSEMKHVGTKGEKNIFSVYSLFTNTDSISNVDVVEKGAVISRTANTAEGLVIGESGVLKYNASKSGQYQFINSFTVAGNFYARGYVKYKYTFNNGKEGGNYKESEIEAIVYSDVCTSQGLN